MEEHLKILKRVGIALIIVGILDIGVMIYCIINGYNYSSSFNIFALLSGVFLFRGGLTAARVVAWFAAFMSVAFVALLISFLFTVPNNLLVLLFSLNSLPIIGNMIFGVMLIALLIWIYIQLRHPAVVTARKEKGLVTAPPKFAFIFGVLLPVSLASLMVYTNISDSSKVVKSRAIQEYGDKYQYHINSMNWSGDSVAARLVAYNTEELFSIYVSCDGSQLTSGSRGCSLRSSR